MKLGNWATSRNTEYPIKYVVLKVMKKHRDNLLKYIILAVFSKVSSPILVYLKWRDFLHFTDQIDHQYV